MDAAIHIRQRVQGPTVLFQDRADAGRALARWIAPKPDPGAVVYALPRGGIPVGRQLADVLGCKLRPALVRKLPIPSDPEMGFGAVTVEGTLRLNDAAIEAFSISSKLIPAIVREVRAEVERRANVYPGGWPIGDVTDRRVWLVDDGLATGLSMLAATDMLRAHEPASLSVAIPVSPTNSIAELAQSADAVWCMAAQDGSPFAVAAFYRDFHELDDPEVLEYLLG